jgi:hypothetical protein
VLTAFKFDFKKENFVLTFSAIIIAGQANFGIHRVVVTRDADVEIGTQSDIANRSEHRLSDIANRLEHRLSNVANRSERRLSNIANRLEHRLSNIANRSEHRLSNIANRSEHSQT